jgi:hypothetical protein
MGMNNLLYQYQNTNEFVCSDGRMSVNGICQAPQPVVEQPVIKQPVINNNQGGGGDGKDTFTKDYSKDVKSNFQWDFDKVGNKIQNFGDTIKGNIDAYDKYVEDNLGISKNVSNVFRAGAVVKGVAAYGLAGALVPFAIPFMAGGALNAKQQKENERITNITNQDTQGDIQTINLQKAATGSSYSTGGIGTSAGASRDPAGTGGGSQQATSSGATNTGRTDGGWGW